MNRRVIVATWALVKELLADLTEAGFRADRFTKRDYENAGPDASGAYVWVAVPDMAVRARLRKWAEDAGGIVWESIDSLCLDPGNVGGVAWVDDPCD